MTAEFRAAALARIGDDDENMRAAAARALAGAVGEVEVRDALLARLGDESPSVRAAVGESLAGAVGEAEVRDTLLARIGDDNARVQSVAAKVLADGIVAEKFGLPAGEITPVYLPFIARSRAMTG